MCLEYLVAVNLSLILKHGKFSPRFILWCKWLIHTARGRDRDGHNREQWFPVPGVVQYIA